jgi:DNA-binding NarL/FixJ family response regulator
MIATVIICEPSVLVREGLKSILSSQLKLHVVSESVEFEALSRDLLLHKPQLLILDPFCVTPDQLKYLTDTFKETYFLCIAADTGSSAIKACLSTGVNGFIFKDCDRTEVEDAINATSMGEKFFCGKAIEALTSNSDSRINCQPLRVSGREAEIIKLIAEGLTNKQIADRLCLSGHTVTTHRKNIMNKLGLTSTAGLVMYAIRENLIQAN